MPFHSEVEQAAWEHMIFTLRITWIWHGQAGVLMFVGHWSTVEQSPTILNHPIPLTAWSCHSRDGVLKIAVHQSVFPLIGTMLISPSCILGFLDLVNGILFNILGSWNIGGVSCLWCLRIAAVQYLPALPFSFSFSPELSVQSSYLLFMILLLTLFSRRWMRKLLLTLTYWRQDALSDYFLGHSIRQGNITG